MVPYKHYEDLSVDEIGKHLVKLWYESSGHKANMLNSQFVSHNIGIYQANNKNLYCANIFLSE